MEKELTWNDLRDRAYRNSVDHGFHNGNESPQHYLCLVVTELAEAVNADRKMRRANMDLFDQNKATPQPAGTERKHWDFCFEQFIKDTVEDELSDAMIRLLDLAGMLNQELENIMAGYIDYSMDESETAEYNSRTFTEQIWAVIEDLLKKPDPTDVIPCALGDLLVLGIHLGIPLWKHVLLKMEYNENRPMKHNRKY